MIKIKKYDKKAGKISFITDMSINLANAIRRSVLEIPIMAIDEVEISQNDSALYDEILAHRIGMIPIKTEKVSGDKVKFKLKEKGPKTIYSSDFKPFVGTDCKLLIVFLEEGQEIQLVATAKPGKGTEHMKYSPGLIYYKHNIDPEILDYVHVDEEGRISYDEDELKEKRVSDEQMNKIRKVSKVDELVFNIESWGQIEVKKIFLEAIDVLDKNLKELGKAVK